MNQDDTGCAGLGLTKGICICHIHGTYTGPAERAFCRSQRPCGRSSGYQLAKWLIYKKGRLVEAYGRASHKQIK